MLWPQPSTPEQVHQQPNPCPPTTVYYQGTTSGAWLLSTYIRPYKHRNLVNLNYNSRKYNILLGRNRGPQLKKKALYRGMCP